MPASREPGPDMKQRNLSAPFCPLIAARSQQDYLRPGWQMSDLSAMSITVIACFSSSIWYLTR
jgi:hypothetical protein